MFDFKKGNKRKEEHTLSEDEKVGIGDRLSNICNWVRANEDTDPNAYEMADIFIEVSKFRRRNTFKY